MTLAVRYTAARTLDTAPAPGVEPGPGEVEPAPACVGICGTDLHIFHGDMDARVATPAVLGHEMSGRILRVGPDVEGWRVGDAVTVMPLRRDDTCPACHAGHQHICRHLDFIGIDSPGAIQQPWTVPASTLTRLPESLPLDRAALVEPTAVAVRDVGRAQVTDGEKTVVAAGVFNSGLRSRPWPADGTKYDYQDAPPEPVARARAIAEVCEEHGTSLPAAVIAFPTTRPSTVNVTLGMRDRAQVTQNVALQRSAVPRALWHDLRERGLIRQDVPTTVGGVP
jgi:hypothetical protein